MSRGHIPRKPRSRRIADRIAYAKHVIKCMSTSPYFEHPIPALEKLKVDVARAEELHIQSFTRTKGVATALAEAMRDVEADLSLLHVLVKVEASRRSPEEAPLVVASAGMDEKDLRGPTRQDFVVIVGERSGEVDLRTASAGRNTSYDWQFSLDGVSWTDHETTQNCRTTITGLLPRRYYYFRCRPRTTAGVGNWSRVICLLVG